MASRTSRARSSCTARTTASGTRSGTTRTTARAAAARSTCARSFRPRSSGDSASSPSRRSSRRRCTGRRSTCRSSATTARPATRRKFVADSIKHAPKPPKQKAEPDTVPIELTVELVDASGHAARLPLGRYGAIRRPLETRVYRRGGRDEQRFAAIFEVVPQTYVLPLADFAKAAPGFVPRDLKTVRLLFDRTPAGTVILSDVGLSTTIDPAFLDDPIP